VFGAFVISDVLFLSKLVRQRLARFSDYVPNCFGALLVRLFRRDRVCGLEYLINFFVYVWWV
jgi:hypothetical protein